MNERPDGAGDDAGADEIVAAVESGSDSIVVPAEMLQEDAPGAPPKPAVEVQNLYARILTMGMAEKIKLALRGNKDARLILIRDASKMIRRLVMMNPRISDGEVISVARNRSVDEDLIRFIVNRREWMRNYQVRLALAQNPRTPLVIAIRQLPTLGERDLRALAKSKNVGASVATQARRMIANMSGPK